LCTFDFNPHPSTFYNTIKISVDAGKSQATDLGNALLNETDTLPSLNLNKTFPHLPDLRSALYQRLHYQQATSFSSLQHSLSSLKQCLDKLLSAIQTLDALAIVEEEEPILGWNAPVYAALPLEGILKLFRQVVDMYIDELRIKEAVVKDYEVEQKDNEQQEDKDKSNDNRRHRIQVLITAWLLSAEIDDKLVQSNLLQITEDMRGY
jgi:hypothetical protein